MSFDVDAFMNQTVEGPMATYLAPPPEGEYLARIGEGENDVKIESIQGKKDPTKTYIKITMMWDIIDEALKASLGRDTIRIRDSFLVDTEDGLLKTGPEDNVTLGSRREAVNLNDGPFNVAMFRGAGPAMVRVSHRPDANDPKRVYAEISRAVKLS